MRTRTALATIALALFAHGGCTPAPTGAPGRGILVIAVDALRYDHLGIAGYDRATSPALDTLGREGVFFRSAYAAAPWQVPAHMALLSGADPRLARRVLPAGVPSSQTTLWHLPDEAPHPAAQFLSQDITTAMFYDHDNLAPVYGYQPGFELYQGPNQDDDTSNPHQGSEAVFRRFLQWISRTPQQKSWFAYLELADLERVWSETDPRWDTYFPPRPELSRVPPVGDAQHVFFALPRSRWAGGMTTLGEYEARYDGAIAELDAGFRRLRTRLEHMGRWENTTVVVVGSYGMSFGESGLLLDSGTFADVDLHVPMIVRAARGIEMRVGLASDALVSTMDLLPTLLDISNVPPAGGMDGVSFARALSGEDARGRLQLHASCAYQEGFATLNRQYCYERTWPGRVQDPRLAVSWFGDSDRRLDLMREAFHDRRADLGLGHLKLSAVDLPIAKTLAQSGENWAERIDERRAVLQGEREPGVARPAGAPDGR